MDDAKISNLQILKDQLYFNWWPEGDSNREILKELVFVVRGLIDLEIARLTEGCDKG